MTETIGDGRTSGVKIVNQVKNERNEALAEIDRLKKERDAWKEQAEQLEEINNYYEKAIAEVSDALTEVTKREQAYRNKALELACFRMATPSCVDCQAEQHEERNNGNQVWYCPEVIKEVDSCLNK